MKQATLCYCIKGDEILLGLKKVRFGAGKWNGYGGKVDPGESNEEAAARELFEESGIATDANALEKIADIQFYFAGKPVFQCHAYVARSWENDAAESEEMRPQWFPIRSMPFDTMWVSDSLWLERALAGEHLRGVVHFNDDGSAVLDASFEALGN
jgi:8-oxo-dGTP pyrophosphatase MutT (NUDIX family)